MIIELICTPFFLIANGIIGLIPVLDELPNTIVDTVSLLTKAMSFFPADVWAMAIGNIVFWVALHLLIGLIKFIVGWIPTMDGG